jgi:hypothetical protein
MTPWAAQMCGQPVAAALAALAALGAPAALTWKLLLAGEADGVVGDDDGLTDAEGVGDGGFVVVGFGVSVAPEDEGDSSAACPELQKKGCFVVCVCPSDGAEDGFFGAV